MGFSDTPDEIQTPPFKMYTLHLNTKMLYPLHKAQKTEKEKRRKNLY